MKFNKRKVRNKIAYSKNTASAKSIYTQTKEEGKIYNIYNYIIYIYTYTHTYTYTFTHTYIYIYIYILHTYAYTYTYKHIHKNLRSGLCET